MGIQRVPIGEGKTEGSTTLLVFLLLELDTLKCIFQTGAENLTGGVAWLQNVQAPFSDRHTFYLPAEQSVQAGDFSTAS